MTDNLEFMDEVAEAVEKVKEEWNETIACARGSVKAIKEYGKPERGTDEGKSLTRLNGLVQDALALFCSMQVRLDLLAQQLLTEEEVQSAQSMLESWKNQYQSLHLGPRNANLQAKANIRKAAQAEVERSASTVMTFGESTGVLKKAKSEYKGHHALLTRTRNLLSTMQRQDVFDRVILLVGFLLFTCAVLYVVSKRIGLLKLQRKVTAAIKAGISRQGERGPQSTEDAFNFMHLHENVVRNVEVPLQNMRDEL